MDFTQSKLAKQDLLIDFVPIYWEPYIGTNEKIVALIATKSRLDSSKAAPTKAYSVLPEKRLVAMMGKTRGSSAHAILNEAAEYLTSRLHAGLDLEDAIPQFAGFTVGKIRRSTGWNLKQVIDSAVRSVSVFGSTEDLFVDDAEAARHTVTTKEFIKKIQKSDFGIIARERFNKKIRLPEIDNNAPEITIDYSYKQLIVQATSLPYSKHSEFDLRREFECKLFEITNLQKSTQAEWNARLLINVEVLENSTLSKEKDIAKTAQDEIYYFAKNQSIEVIEVHSIDDAITKLQELSSL